MADFRRYAFLYRTEDGDREEWATAGDGLTAEEAVGRFYETHSGESIIKPLRGDVPEDLDLEPPETESEPDGLEDPVELDEEFDADELVAELEKAEQEDDEGNSMSESEDSSTGTETPSNSSTEPPFDSSDYSVDELKDEIGEGSEYSHDELEALYQAEQDGDNRKTAISAIEAVMDNGD